MNNRPTSKTTKIYRTLWRSLSPVIIPAAENSVCFLANYWAYILVGSNVAVILMVTLSPYRFVTPDYAALTRLLWAFFNPDSDLYDLISNVLLFILLGFGLGRIFQRRSSIRLILISLLVSSALSLLVEILQLFLPHRTSSLNDLLTNIAGGLLGTVAFFLWSSGSSWIKSHKWLTKTKLSFAALSYILLVLCLMFTLQHAYNFSNWNRNFPLSVGNEYTGDRPWQGSIKQLYVATHSLSKQEIAQTLGRQSGSTIPWFTGYQLTGNGDYRDQNGRSPNLQWQKVPSIKETTGMISLSQQHWLLTPEPATKLNQAIQKTSQFSLLTTVATKDIHQTGPARIISLSASPFRRNLTIGQQGSGVVVRLRTPLSGLGTSNTNLTFPNVLADTKPHKLLFNFNGSSLQLFVDHQEEVSTLHLSPAILLFHFLPAIGIRGFEITPTNKWLLQLAFYGLILSPPAALMLLSKFINAIPENTA